jgi:hypothetical protein
MGTTSSFSSCAARQEACKTDVIHCQSDVLRFCFLLLPPLSGSGAAALFFDLFCSAVFFDAQRTLRTGAGVGATGGAGARTGASSRSMTRLCRGGRVGAAGVAVGAGVGAGDVLIELLSLSGLSDGEGAVNPTTS